MIVHGSSGTRFVPVSGSANSLVQPAIDETISGNPRILSSSSCTLSSTANFTMKPQSSNSPLVENGNFADTPSQGHSSGRLQGNQPGCIIGNPPRYVAGLSSPQISTKDQPQPPSRKLSGSRPLIKPMRPPVALKSAAVASGSSPLAGSMESMSRDHSYKGKI